MALLALQDLVAGGAQPSLQAAAGGGDTVPYDPYSFVEVVNGGGGAITATLVIPGALHGQALADIAHTVNAAARAKIRIPKEAVDPATGVASITYSGVTSVTVAAIRVPGQ